MLRKKRYGAIDIGSNGVRMLISDVLEQDHQGSSNKVTLLKAPIRLGKEVFEDGYISKETGSRLYKALHSFSLLLDVYQVDNYRACATSAMRQAENKDDLIQEIQNLSGIQINVIDGVEEANIIASVAIPDLQSETTLYMDVGGGSTEYSLISDKKILSSRSFDFGTLRGLEMFESDNWDTAKNYITETTKPLKSLNFIGSGGNINTTARYISNSKQITVIPYEELKSFYQEIMPLDSETLSFKYGFKPDRCDVIKPGLKIYLSTMEWCNATEIIVPKIGLVDGIINTLYLSDKRNGHF